MFVYLLGSSVLVFLCCYVVAIFRIEDADNYADDEADQDDFLLQQSTMIGDAFAYDRAGGPQLYDVGERIVDMFD